jgi:hypothetical protein
MQTGDSAGAGPRPRNPKGFKKQMITKECFGCGKVTAHQHLHDCTHGIAETHMVGSERFVCELCGHVTRAGSDGAERFPFTFDEVRRESQQ